MKLYNLRCLDCGHEEELLLTNKEVNDKENEPSPNCPKCKTVLVQFNFKNNPQVWKFMDTRV